MMKTGFIVIRVLVLFLFVSFVLPGFVLAATNIQLDTGSLSPLLSTVENPNNYIVSPGTGLDGVARLYVSFNGNRYGGSGVLLAGGQYLLTAAHMVDNGTSFATSFTAEFKGGTVTRTASQYYLPTGWTTTRKFDNGYDIAIVKLTDSVPAASVTGYNIYSGNALHENINLAGYGIGGTGALGTNFNSYPFGQLRTGQNTYEAYWNIMGSYGLVPGSTYGSIFAYDFDDGSDYYNTIQKGFGITSTTGLNINEVLATPGDSGGPSFFNGQIAGIHSFYASYGKPYDLDSNLNATFGELGGDTNVAYFASWINQITATPVPTPVPVPGAIWLLTPALAGIFGVKRRIAKAKDIATRA
ncbi:MAG: trypsin-like serine protease [Proteobacteria bacterium]|nr:trypsin-like serine protease [Pseudomonadota bacterium]